MEKQQKISQKKLVKKIGSTQTVIVDRVSEINAEARTIANSPEIDGIVYLENPKGLQIGDMLDVKIKGVKDYDLYAGPIIESN